MNNLSSMNISHLCQRIFHYYNFIPVIILVCIYSLWIPELLYTWNSPYPVNFRDPHQVYTSPVALILFLIIQYSIFYILLYVLLFILDVLYFHVTWKYRTIGFVSIIVLILNVFCNYFENLPTSNPITALLWISD